MSKRLFIGVYTCGLVYADRMREENGDYRRLCFLPYTSLEPEWSGRVSPELRREIERDVATMQARRGQTFQISTCGHTVRLGG